jgi:hypothetical protein
MWSYSLQLAAAAVLAAAQIATPAAARGAGASGGGHFVGHGHFANHFRGRFGFQIVLIAPYGWGWPYADYDEAPLDTYGNTMTVIPYPPPAPPAATASACDRKTETFTVPSADGGTREIKVTSCP